MTPNAKPSEHISVLATIDPLSQAAGTASTGWVSVADHHAFLALIDAGVMTATSTLDANITQAQDSSGTNPKALSPAKAITQLLAAGGNNRQALLNFRASDLDTANGYGFVKLNVVIAAAASLISATLLGFYPRYEDGAAFNQTGVAQVV